MTHGAIDPVAPAEAERQAPEPERELDEGPYGLRGEHTPPLGNMIGGYGIIFAIVVLIPLLLFLLIRVVIL